MRSASWTIVLALGMLFDIFLFGITVEANSLEVMEHKDLDKLIQQEQFVIVLFSSSEANDRTEDLEAELAAVREDLVDSLNAWVVKTIDNPAKDKYTPDNEPVVVFFRKQKAVIYDGAANEDEILETVSMFKEKCIQDLTDTNFEHLTQASTGATTGDWFVLFYRDECEECENIMARLETVACRMKGRINVAKMNKGSTGAVTGRRFGVASLPEIIFFRLGKMYRYSIGKYDIPSMTSFITGWYKNVPSESIPLPKTPFDDLVQLCVDYLRDYPMMLAVIFGVPIVLGLAFFFLMRSDDSPKPKKKKKKEKSK